MRTQKVFGLATTPKIGGGHTRHVQAAVARAAAAAGDVRPHESMLRERAGCGRPRREAPLILADHIRKVVVAPGERTQRKERYRTRIHTHRPDHQTRISVAFVLEVKRVPELVQDLAAILRAELPNAAPRHHGRVIGWFMTPIRELLRRLLLLTSFVRICICIPGQC